MYGTPGPTGMRLRDGGWMSQGAVRRMGENAVAGAMISLSATGGGVSKPVRALGATELNLYGTVGLLLVPRGSSGPAVCACGLGSAECLHRRSIRL